jgi:hypothetical protein
LIPSFVLISLEIVMSASCRRAWVAFTVGCLVLAVIEPAHAQFDQLVTKVPSTTNAIVLLDGQRLMASPLATKEGWKEKYEQAFAAGLVSIAPDTQHMILASQMDFQYMRPLWELAIADFGDEHSIAEIARHTKGTIDTVGDLPAVMLRDDSYCVQLGAKRLGVMAPANRQSVARWLRDSSARNTSALSPYLQGTLTAAETSQVVIAFDLEDSVPPEFIRAKLAASPTLSGKSIDLDAATKALSGIRGLVLEVAITEGSYGRLMIHFREDASVLAPYAKQLLLEVLGNMGAMIDDIAGWTAKSEPLRFTLSGTLSAEGRKRVLSLIDHPTAALIAANDARNQSQQPEESKPAQASLQYFKTITTMRDDLREKSNDAKTFGQYAMWIDNNARRIDRLPILNVDPELLAYGQYVASRMRDISSSLKGIGIQSAAQEAQVYQQFSTSATAGGGYWGGGYSYYTQWNNVAGQRRAIGAQVTGQGATTARGIAQEIENETAKVRQAMSQKYQINF